MKPQPSSQSFAYWAFLSYSHGDLRPCRWPFLRWLHLQPLIRLRDRTWGRWFHQRLEAFRIPGWLAGQVDYPGKPGGQRLTKVFRDRDELPLSSDLGKSLYDALDASRHFVILCSPRAAQSKWINAEVQHTLETKDAGKIIAVILEGDPGSVDPLKRCLPDGLRIESVRVIDARSGKAGKKAAVLQVIAFLTGVPLEVIEQAHCQWRRWLWMRRGVACFLLLIAGFVLNSYHQRALAGATALAASRDDLTLARTALAADKSGEAMSHLARALRRTPGLDPALHAALAALTQRSWALPAGPLSKASSIVHPNHVMIPIRTAFAARKNQVAFAEASQLQLHTLTEEGWKAQVFKTNSSGIATALDVSKDGRRVAMGGDRGTIDIVDALTAQPVGVPLQVPGAVQDLDFSADGSRLLAVANMGLETGFVVRRDLPKRGTFLFDVATGRLLSEQAGDSLAQAASLTADGRQIASGSLGGLVQRWDSSQPTSSAKDLMLKEPVVQLAHNAAGDRLVVALASGSLGLFDATTGNCVKAFESQSGLLLTASFSPDDATIACAADNGSTILCDTVPPSSNPRVMNPAGKMRSARFSADGLRLVTAGEDRLARVWDVATGRALCEPMRHTKALWDAAFSNDGTHVITVDVLGHPRLWDVRPRAAYAPAVHARDTSLALSMKMVPSAGELVTNGLRNGLQAWDLDEFPVKSHTLLSSQKLSAFAVDPKGAGLLTFGSGSGNEIQCWNLANPKSRPLSLTHSGGATPQWHPAQEWVLLMPETRTLQRWNTTTGEPLGPSLVHEHAIRACALSPDGEYVFVATGEKQLHRWSFSADTTAERVLRHADAVDGVEFSPDGRWLVTRTKKEAAEDSAQAFAKSMSAVKRIFSDKPPPHQPSPCAIHVWDAAGLAPAGQTLELPDAVTSSAIAADGSRLVLARTDGLVSLHELPSMKQVGSALPHGGRVHTTVFDPAGRWLVTGSDGGKVGLWDARTGDQVGEAWDQPGAVSSLSCSPDGRWLFAVSDGDAWERGDERSARAASLRRIDLSHLDVGDWTETDRLDLAGWLETFAGLRLDAAGALIEIPEEESLQAITRFRASPPPPSALRSFLTWFLGDPSTRPMSPAAKHSVTKVFADLASDSSAATLQNAALDLAGAPVALARLARAQSFELRDRWRDRSWDDNRIASVARRIQCWLQLAGEGGIPDAVALCQETRANLADIRTKPNAINLEGYVLEAVIKWETPGADMQTVSLLEEAMAHTSREHLWLRMYLALAWWKAGNKPEALSHYQRVIQADPRWSLPANSHLSPAPGTLGPSMIKVFNELQPNHPQP